MNTQIALRHRPHVAWSSSHFFRILRWPGIALLGLLSLGLLWSWSPAPDGTTEAAPTSQLVHWQDASHDWLLVVDPATRELVVYDANDGRPLERLGTDDGLPAVQSIAQQGSWVFVTGGQHAKMRVLKLPVLQAVAVNSR
ncbi:hypothetical protein ACPPVV_13120 [Rhodanobacter sp. Col0626]|uniref:hypothetical protein n=1 Tax=Rhodanobacter sp. Col0626 TaxID=3415679 RepID=UPI003CE90B82